MVNKTVYCVLIGLQNRFTGPVWCCFGVVTDIDNGNNKNKNKNKPSPSPSRSREKREERRLSSNRRSPVARRFAVCLAHRFADSPSWTRLRARRTVPRASTRRSVRDSPSPSRSPSRAPAFRASKSRLLVRKFRLLRGKREENTTQPATTGACNFRSNFELLLKRNK